MLFNIPFIADWKKIREHRQQLTDLNNALENKGSIDYDFKVGQKVLLRKEVIVDIGLVEKPFQHTCLYHLQDCVVFSESGKPLKKSESR